MKKILFSSASLFSIILLFSIFNFTSEVFAQTVASPNGRLKIYRVGENLETSSAPVSRLFIDQGNSITANPYHKVTFTPGEHIFKFTNSQGFKADIQYCYYGYRDPECRLFLDFPYSLNPNVTCNKNNACSLTVPTVAGKYTKVVARFYRASTPSGAILSATKNSAIANPRYVSGASGVKIGSFVLTSNSVDSITVGNLQFALSALNSPNLQNLKIWVNGLQFGATRSTLGSGGVYDFFGNINIPSGGSVIVDVTADILNNSPTGTFNSLIALNNWLAFVNSSHIGVPFGGIVYGQNVIIANDRTTLTISRDSMTASAGNVIMGSTGNSLFTLRLSNNNFEDIKLSDLTITDTQVVPTTVSSFYSLEIYDGAIKVASTPSLYLTSPFSIYSKANFSFPTPIIIPKNASKSLTVKGSVATFDSNGAVSGSEHVFSIASTSTADIVVIGKDSQLSANVKTSGIPEGNKIKVVKSDSDISSNIIGSQNNRVRTTVDDLANISFSADPSGDVILNSISFKFAGTLLSTTSSAATISAISLLDASTNLAPAGCASLCKDSITLVTTTDREAKFNFTAPFILTRGTSKTFKIRMDSSVAGDALGIVENLSVFFDASTDVIWSDGISNNLQLPVSILPFNIVSGLGY